MHVGTHINRVLRHFEKDKLTVEIASEMIGQRIGMNTRSLTLRAHQLRGLRAVMRHISRHQAGGVLAHEMGLGKSLQALIVAATIIQIAREQRADGGEGAGGGSGDTARILIVVPTSMISTWLEYWKQYMLPASDVRLCTLDDRRELVHLLPPSQRTWHVILIASHQSIDRTLCRELDLAEWRNAGRRRKAKASELSRLMFSQVFTRGAGSGASSDRLFSGRHEWTAHVESWGPGVVLCTSFFDLMIVDEAHVAKNPHTSLFCSMCLVRSDLKLGLTGTPLVNSVVDVAALAHLTQVIGTWSNLGREDYWMAHELMRPPRIHEWMHVEKRDANVLSLPSVHVRKVNLRLSKREMAAYDAVLNMPLESDYGSAMRQLGMLRRVACLGSTSASTSTLTSTSTSSSTSTSTPAGRKVVRTAQLIRDVLAQDSSHRIVFFSEWTACLDAVSRALAQAPALPTDVVARLDGSCTTRDRDRAVQRFQAGSARLFMVTHGAGGVGLNLTRGTHVIMFEPYWNFARMQQAISRVVRMGCSAAAVNVIFLVAKATIEEIILNKVAASKFEQGRFHIDGVGEPVERYRLNFSELRDMLDAARAQRKAAGTRHHLADGGENDVTDVAAQGVRDPPSTAVDSRDRRPLTSQP